MGMDMKRYVIGITGASGSVYGLRTAEALLDFGAVVHLIVTDTGRRVMQYETGENIEDWALRQSKTYGSALIVEDNTNLFSSVASGSYRVEGMIIVPCSMSTLAKIAHGITPDLLSRAADVMLKQKRRLIIVPRETPLSSIHIQNMLTLANCGAHIVPAMPGFYCKPQSIDAIVDFMVGKILDCLDIENTLYQRWKGPEIE